MDQSLVEQFCSLFPTFINYSQNYFETSEQGDCKHHFRFHLLKSEIMGIISCETIFQNQEFLQTRTIFLQTLHRCLTDSMLVWLCFICFVVQIFRIRGLSYKQKGPEVKKGQIHGLTFCKLAQYNMEIWSLLHLSFLKAKCVAR